MVPDKFNMVDMEGIDLIESQGVEVPGLYQKLVESIAQCRYQCLYNWKFDGILIPPTYVEMIATDESVTINGGVSVDVDNVIHIDSLAVEPALDTLSVTENGIYTPEQGVDGFSSVEVEVNPTIQSLAVSANGVYIAPEGVDGYSPVTVEIPTSTAEYEYIDPDYSGIGYSYVAVNGGYYGADSYGQVLSIYEVPAGDYVVFCGNPVGNRFRCVCFYGKTVEDFMPARDTSMAQTLQFNGDLNVTGTAERTGDALIQRLYFTMAQPGCVCVGTSNSSQSVESILLKINS